MWFPALLFCLITVQLSAADFGLPVTIPYLRNSIVGTIGKGVEPTNDILRELKTLKSKEFNYSFNRMKESLQDVIGNMTKIQNNTLNSLMQAINDNHTSPRIVFDRLYVSKSAQELLLTTSKKTLDKYATEFGMEKFALLNMSRGALKSSLETLQTALIQLDDSISKAQRAKPVTQENIQSVVTKSQIADLALSVVSLEMSISKLYQLTESSLKSFKLVDQDANNTFTQLDKIFILGSVFIATENRTTSIEKNLLWVIAKMNSTALSAYKSLIKNSFKEASPIIESFLLFFNTTVKILNESASNFRTLFNAYVQKSLPKLFSYLHDMVQLNLDVVASQMFKNSTFAETCVQRCPLVNGSQAIIVKMLEECVNQQLAYLPEVERMFNELLQTFNALTVAPLEDLRTCSSKLSRSLCLSNFTATFFGNSTAVANITLAIKLDERTQALFMATSNELGSAYDRVGSCVSPKDSLAALMELRSKRTACYATGGW